MILEARVKPQVAEANIGSMIHTILQVFRKNEWYRPWQSDKIIRSLLTREGEPMIEELGRSPLPVKSPIF